MAKSGKKTDVNTDLIRQLAGLLDEMNLSEIEYGVENLHVRVARGTAAPTQAPSRQTGVEEETAEIPASADEDEFAPDHPGLVTAPMVGVVYTANDPDSPPFVKVGDTVSDGQTLLLIEAMKVFNPIKAPRAGQVARILITSGTPVEYGEPLMILT
jgi:acetyl-CoA carboxylase biotin carboxyl carrier protein